MTRRARASAGMLAATLMAMAGQPAGQDALPPGEATVREIAAGTTHRFAIDLAGGEFVRLVVDGHGTLIDLSIASAQGERIADRERRGGLRDPIVWSYVAGEAMRLDVAIASRESSGAPRRYALTIERRAAGAGDADRAAAAHAIERAERLDRSGAADAPAALAQYEAAPRHRGGRPG